MAPKRRNMFYRNKKQETTEIGTPHVQLPSYLEPKPVNSAAKFPKRISTPVLHPVGIKGMNDVMDEANHESTGVTPQASHGAKVSSICEEGLRDGRSVESELPKITVDTLIDKLKQYIWSLELQENSSNETTLTPNIDENLQDLFQKLYDKLESMSGTWDPTNIDRADFTTDTPLIKFKGFVSPVKFSGMAQNTISKLNVTQHLDFELSIEFENIMGEGYYDLDFNILSVLPLYGAGDFSLKGAMNSIKLSGMGQYSVDILNVTQNLDFQIGFGFANLMVEGDYDIDFNVLTLLPFYGAGEFGILLTGFNISLAANFQEGPDSLQGNHLKLDFKLDQIQLEMGGFAGGGKVASFINNVLSGVGADIIMEYKDVILDLINPILESEMNRMLARDKITIEFVVNAIKEFLKRT
ncbi:hypothetical protein AAG570_010260 [Ranatra chinensis]|uniref:Uncharacterized protein n=1 Tax=Ranatra chinensis TaxID=642074 RepID=A0ABD0YM13_9HEMI